MLLPGPCKNSQINPYTARQSQPVFLKGYGLFVGQLVLELSGHFVITPMP